MSNDGLRNAIKKVVIKYAIIIFTIKYLNTMKVIEFARTYDKVIYTIRNDGLRYAIQMM